MVVLHNGPISWRERIDIALAASQRGAAISGPTALELDGFSGFGSDAVHLTLPQGARIPRLPGLVVHRSRILTDLDIHPLREPRRTRPARSVVDFASWQATPERARGIVIAAVQQGLVNVRELRETLKRRGTCRHRALIIQSILDARGGVQSLPERDMGRIWAATRLPKLSRQERVGGPEGRFHLDGFCGELGFGFEVHGIPHHDIAQWDRDLTRANEILIGGVPILVFTSFAVRHCAVAVSDQLQRMAVARGWFPSETKGHASTLLERPKGMTFRPSGRRT